MSLYKPDIRENRVIRSARFIQDIKKNAAMQISRILLKKQNYFHNNVVIII